MSEAAAYGFLPSVATAMRSPKVSELRVADAIARCALGGRFEMPRSMG